MYKKYLIVLIIDILILASNTSETIAKYAFEYTLDVASIDTVYTMSDYYFIKYMERGDRNEKTEIIYKGSDNDADGSILRTWIYNKKDTLISLSVETYGSIPDFSDIW